MHPSDWWVFRVSCRLVAAPPCDSLHPYIWHGWEGREGMWRYHQRFIHIVSASTHIRRRPIMYSGKLRWGTKICTIAQNSRQTLPKLKGYRRVYLLFWAMALRLNPLKSARHAFAYKNCLVKAINERNLYLLSQRNLRHTWWSTHGNLRLNKTVHP